MWRFLLLFCVSAQVGHCSCPDGFELVRNGECRGSIGNFTLVQNQAITTAVAKCNAIQAQPVIIRDHVDQAYWSGRGYANERDALLFLGLVCNSESSKWEWVDGSPVDYMPINHDSALDKACTYGDSFYIKPNGVWHGWTNNVDSFDVDISCIKQLRTPLTDDACDYYEDDAEDGVCYQVGETAENWQDAQMICKKFGANLASIHNPQENSFLRRLAVSKGDVNGLLLGAAISGKEEKFGWIDGSDWNYDNFAPGFPRPGFGDCIVMDTSTSAGQWKNIDYTEAYPVACIREKKAPADPVCSTETWKEGAIITSPGFPYDASTPCDYYLLVDEGKRVEVEIIMLEANSCCDHFILYDGYVGGVVLANLTGAIYNTAFTTTSSHKMLVSWQPNGGSNVPGFAMTFRSV